ncbi:hypothetical protein LEL_01541 [Akanthomyces lecanii RCEF 1005]|uniref:Uncharacterized protein n=1 Tax=Akanthomyces lecanii RCEF 1005 TaxID=1081108 RepID=A0A162KP36_CORDF|nr:hypothetical protein LEL_01541 [Akanthomyces lecanii RCEF 1005]
MPLAPEAIIGIIALVLALPPVLMILCRWRKSTWRASLPVTESATSCTPSFLAAAIATTIVVVFEYYWPPPEPIPRGTASRAK